MAQKFVVIRDATGKGSEFEAAFNDEAEAQSHVTRLNNLARQRWPHPGVCWRVKHTDCLCPECCAAFAATLKE